jgi:hypothetical protein
MGSTVESVDLYCPMGVAGSAVPLQPAKEVELADLRCLAEEAGLAGSVVVAESPVGQSWTLQLPYCILEGMLD